MIIRNETARLRANIWGDGRSVWEPDGIAPEVEFLGVRFDQAPAQVVEALGVTDVCIRSRRYRLEGRPLLASDSYIPQDIAAGTRIAEQDTGAGGTFARLAELGHAPVRFREDVMLAGPQLASAHGFEADTPLLLSIRTAFDADDRPVELSRLIHNPRQITLRFEFPA